MNLKLDISFFIRHCYYLNRVNIKNQKSKTFRCNNSACEHTAIATKIGFDNQLPSRIARLNAKGETSIDQLRNITNASAVHTPKSDFKIQMATSVCVSDLIQIDQMSIFI